MLSAQVVQVKRPVLRLLGGIAFHLRVRPPPVPVAHAAVLPVRQLENADEIGLGKRDVVAARSDALLADTVGTRLDEAKGHLRQGVGRGRLLFVPVRERAVGDGEKRLVIGDGRLARRRAVGVEIVDLLLKRLQARIARTDVLDRPRFADALGEVEDEIPNGFLRDVKGDAEALDGDRVRQERTRRVVGDRVGAVSVGGADALEGEDAGMVNRARAVEDLEVLQRIVVAVRAGDGEGDVDLGRERPALAHGVDGQRDGVDGRRKRGRQEQSAEGFHVHGTRPFPSESARPVQAPRRRAQPQTRANAARRQNRA